MKALRWSVLVVLVVLVRLAAAQSPAVGVISPSVVGIRAAGKAIGVDPGTGPGFPVYADRDVVSDWEAAQLTPHDGGQFDVRFLASNRQLSIQPDGSLESRPAGAVYSWELVYATQQPDGSALLYRFDAGVLVKVMTVEAHQ